MNRTWQLAQAVVAFPLLLLVACGSNPQSAGDGGTGDASTVEDGTSPLCGNGQRDPGETLQPRQRRRLARVRSEDRDLLGT